MTTLLDARAHDLDEEPPATLAALEAYAAESSGRLVLLALEVLGVGDAAAQEAGRSAGIAYALAGLLVAAPFHARARRLYLPQDLVVRHDVDLERSLFALKSSPELAAVARDIAACAEQHLEAARQHRDTLPRGALPALLLAMPSGAQAQGTCTSHYDLMSPIHRRDDRIQSLRLSWAFLRHRY